MRECKDNCMIRIIGKQWLDEDCDSVELMTTGSFHRKESKFYIQYNESEATGFAGSRTTLVVSPDDGMVTMIRHGSVESQLIVQKGSRNQCRYGTGYVDMILGVTGNEMNCDLSQEGGSLYFAYSLDVNASLVSENSVQITVRID